MTADRLLAVFDLDGTLIDSEAVILAAMAEGFAAIGAPVPAADALRSIVGLSLPVALGRLAPEAVPGDVEALAEGYRAAYFARIATAPLPFFPGLRAALEALAARGDVTLGIATGKSRRGVDALLAAHGIGGLFATVQVSDDHPSKPHPAMLEAAMAETGIAARRSVMVGDTSFDMEMARAAGMSGLGVTWGFHPAEALAAADRVIADGAALVPALDDLWARRAA
jgi:phosphoglycolate phosphatase